jgi:hypothetical protein
MVYFMVLAIGETDPDPIIDYRDCLKRGDIVNYGETAPDNVVRDFPKHVWFGCDIPLGQAEGKMDDWQYILEYEIVATSLALDGARIRIYTLYPGLATEYGVTKAKVEGFINNWGGTVFSEDTNEIVFDITVEAIYKSAGFWGQLPADLGIVITETDYDQDTGIHTATVDATDATITLLTIKKKLESADGITITSISAPTATIEVERQAIRQHFIGELQFHVNKTIVSRRWAISEAGVSAAESASGYLEVTPIQLANNLVDKTIT